MNTELLFGGSVNGSSSPGHSSSFPSLNGSGEVVGGEESYMSPVKPRSQEDITSYTTPLRLGLSLGRSQSAAPETWEYGNSMPASTKPERDNRDGNGFFGRSGIFDEEEEDKESFLQSPMRRPASTGVIGRRNEKDEDVSSILETLGLASLESTDNDNNEQPASPYAAGSPIGGIGSYTSSAVKQPSIMEKINEGGDLSNNGSSTKDFFIGGEQSSSSNNLFANQSHQQLGLQNNSSVGSSNSLQNQGVQYPSASDVSCLPGFSLV